MRLIELCLAALCASSPLDSPAPSDDPSPREEAPEPVQLRASDGIALAALYFAPDVQERVRAPAALFLHAAGSSTESVEAIARHVAKKGVAALALDLRGHGASATAGCDWRALEPDERAAFWDAALLDVEAAAAHLRGRPELATSAGVVASGKSGELAARLALDDATIAALVVVAAQDGTGEGLVASLSQLAGLPVLYVASKEERESTTRLAAAVARAGPRGAALEIELFDAERDELLTATQPRNTITRWLRAKLRPRR